MASSKKEKHYANSRARRHSEVIISHGKKSKKDKDTDTESVSSSTPSSSDTTVVPPPPEPKKCPLRLVMTGLFEADNEAETKKPRGCPLRRVQLWHTIPLALLAIINLLLVIIALFGLASYRIAIGVQEFVIGLAKNDLDHPYPESVADSEDGTLVSGKT